MTIEKLTNIERQDLEGDLIGRKALRIIDTHEADRAALVEQAAHYRGEITRQAEDLAAAEQHAKLAEAAEYAQMLRADAAESRVRELEATWNNARAACLRAGSSLAAATALLGEWLETADEQELNASPYEGTQAFLANQPAAPTRTDCDQSPCLGSPGPGCCPPAAPTCTEAEQAVLDAARDWHALDTSVNAERLHHYCAELARREAAK